MTEFVFTAQTNGTVTATVTGYPEVSANAATQALARFGAEQQLNAANVTRRTAATNTATPYLKWRTAVANVRRGVGNAKLALLGDSTTRGTGAAAGSAAFLNGYPPQLAARLAAAGLAAGWQNVFGSGNVTLSSSDSRVALSGGATQTAVNLTLGGAAFQLTGASHTFSFTPTVACDTFDVYYLKVGGGGTFTINLDGGATLSTPSSSGTTSYNKVTVTGSLGTPTLNCVQASGVNYIVGVDAYNSATKQVSCWNLGASGATAANIASTSNGYASLSGLAAIAPDLTLLCVGINDWTAGTALPSFEKSVQSVIDTARASGDFVLVSPAPTGGVASLSAQRPYVDLLRRVADINDVRFVELWNRWGSYSSANAAGFFNDTLHPSGIGYADKTDLIFREIMAI